MLPPPPFGSSIDSFLQWEADAISALGDAPECDSIWHCWQATEGLCITAKEKRLPQFELAKTNFQQRDLEIATRRSGGTTVPHGEGILAITHIAKSNGSKKISEAYLMFCEKIQSVLANLGYQTDVGPAVGAYCDGDYNVLIDGLKLAGTSQRWTRAGSERTEIVLNHAVMLVSCNSAEATQRVNQFHQLAEQRTPFTATASTSLWDVKHSQDSEQDNKYLNRQDFFNEVATAFQAFQPD